MIRLANAPTPHVTLAQSLLDMLRVKNNPTYMHRPIPAPEPSPEPNPEPDGALSARRAAISATDWDELFHAIQTRLEKCVSEALTKMPELPLHERHAVTQKTVLECVEAMRQLHADLIYERQLQQKR